MHGRGGRRDATLKELSTLIKEVNVDARRKELAMSFNMVRDGFGKRGRIGKEGTRGRTGRTGRTGREDGWGRMGTGTPSTLLTGTPSKDPQAVASTSPHSELTLHPSPPFPPPLVLIQIRQIYSDVRGIFHQRELGLVHNSRKSENDDRTLDDIRFATGDFIDVAIVRSGGGGGGGGRGGGADRPNGSDRPIGGRPGGGRSGDRDSFGGRSADRDSHGGGAGAERWARIDDSGNRRGGDRDRPRDRERERT